LLIHKFTTPLIPARFLLRLNRFLIEADLDGERIKCHLHDPGRLPDILSGERKILLMEKDGKRKTRYDVIAVYVGGEWVFTHSGYHSLFAIRIMEKRCIKDLKEYRILKKEFRYGKSRMDFLLSNDSRALLEVKGCTLTKGDTALFPDAPTERGRKHVMELMDALEEGYKAFLLFLIMRRAKRFSPNKEVDKKFAIALKKSSEKGVKIIASIIKFDGKNVYYKGTIPVHFP